MKVYVDKIPEEGLDLTEKIDPGNISLDAGEGCASFTKSIDVKAKITKLCNELLANVAIESGVEYTCARCLAKFQNVFKKEFNVTHEVKSGDVLELDEDIRQEIILDNPMKVVCKPDCKGLCPRCGQNLNISMCDCK